MSKDKPLQEVEQMFREDEPAFGTSSEKYSSISYQELVNQGYLEIDDVRTVQTGPKDAEGDYDYDIIKTFYVLKPFNERKAGGKLLLRKKGEFITSEG